MPHLRSIRIGKLDLNPCTVGVNAHLLPQLYGDVVGDFQNFLSILVSCRVWCQYSAKLTRLAYPLFRNNLPYEISYHIHTHYFGKVSVIPGGTTFIHVHAPPIINGYRPNDKTSHSSGPDFVYTIFIFASNCIDVERHNKRKEGKLNLKTRIIIAGLVLPRSEPEGARVGANDELELGRLYVRTARQYLKEDGKTENMADIDIEVRKVEDMPACLGCGMGLGNVKARSKSN
jgi:hypothetical protein